MKALNYNAAEITVKEWSLKYYRKSNGDLVITNKSGKPVFTFNSEGVIISKRSCFENEIKEVTEALFSVVELQQENTWLVDGKEVTNDLSYGEMYNRYGMDFE